MHERFEEMLLGVARTHGANLRLVSRYTDERLGMGDEKTIQVFLPDMHVLSNARRERYLYGLNHEPMLLSVVQGLMALKAATAEDESVVVFHIGDYLDLWRESLDLNDVETPKRIKRDHEKLAGLLEDRRLNAHFLLGNHDFDLYRSAAYNAWERRYFIPDDSPGVLILHGDYFDPVERELPRELRDIGVYLFGKGHQAGTAILDKMADRAHRLNEQLRVRDAEPPRTADLGTACGDGDCNVQREGDSVDGGLLFLDKALAEVERANAESETAIRAVIIGHTHHARIATCAMADGTPFALIDCGAWIENCKHGDGSEFPNAQIAALSANQARIYQLDLEPS